MDEGTKLAFLGIAIAIISLLIAVMTIQTDRLRYLLQGIMCMSTAYGLLKLYFHFRNIPFHVWSFEEYNIENFKIYFSGTFWIYFLCVLISIGVFYLLLPHILELFLHEKIKKHYLNKFNKDEAFFQKTLHKIKKVIMI